IPRKHKPKYVKWRLDIVNMPLFTAESPFKKREWLTSRKFIIFWRLIPLTPVAQYLDVCLESGFVCN
ncbi:hypothetical protein, partial [uncultured Rhodoblastus sp.]|uniref:hypothetical protein n=1 Tax=uncultured Rhodoblastus sp. TaxID=543037 RepID=UPI0025FDF326